MTQDCPPPIDTTLSTYAQRSIDVLEGEPCLDVDTYQTLRSLDATKRLVRVIGQSVETLFDVQARTRKGFTLAQVKGTTLGQGLLDLVLKDGVHRLPDRHPGLPFAYEVELLREVLSRRALDQVTSADMAWNTLEYMLAMRDQWNQLVQDLRDAIQSPSYVQRQLRNTKTAAKNLRSAQRWFSHICDRYARLLALRLDLYYPPTYALHSGNAHSVSLEEIFDHRNQFLRGLPRWIENDALLGYLCKTEFQLKRNVHHHLLILVDGSKLRKDLHLNESLGLRWRKLTHDRGTFFNVNRMHSNQLDNSCVGELDVRDAQKVSLLRTKVIPYLVKPDYLIRWVIPHKHRLMLKSVAKPLTGTKPGRPRAQAPSPVSSDTEVAQGVTK